MMHIECDMEKLNRVLADFSSATGIIINFADKEYLTLPGREAMNNPYCAAIQSTKMGYMRCLASDRALLDACRTSGSMQCHVCHAGLTDVAVPIEYEGLLLGYIILGQMKTSPDLSPLRPILSELSKDTEQLGQSYNSLTLYTKERIDAISSIAVMLAKHVLLENIVRPEKSTSLGKVLDYVERNLDKHLTVTDICEHTYLSKTTLYNVFHTHFSCTVNEYINARRIERAEELLKSTEDRIEEISQKVGFSSAAYFSRLFKQKHGVSPLSYRKNAPWNARTKKRTQP